MKKPQLGRNSLLITGIIVLTTLLTCGCVERKLMINTEPEGALVYLNDEEIGITPVTIEFSWYGDYRVRIEKQGFETLNTHRKLVGPLHDRFPFDFMADFLWPQRIVDSYEWEFKLTEYQPPERDDLIKASKVMRAKAITELKKEEQFIEEEKRLQEAKAQGGEN